MGKKDKEHRAKVAKRNRRVAQEKSGMQKVFDKLMEEQIQKLKNSEIREHFESFKNKIIKSCFIFYYSSKNIDNNIKNAIDNKIIK